MFWLCNLGIQNQSMEKKGKENGNGKEDMKVELKIEEDIEMKGEM